MSCAVLIVLICNLLRAVTGCPSAHQPARVLRELLPACIFSPAPCNLVPSSGVSQAMLLAERTTKLCMQNQSSQQAFRSDPQVPFPHRRTSSSFSQSRPEDGSDVVSSLGSGYDSTRITGSVAQGRHTMRSPTTTAMPSTSLVVGGRRKTPKPLDPTTPPYYYKQLPQGQTFPVQGGSTPQYFSFWDMTFPSNTSASPPDTFASGSSTQPPSLMQSSLPAGSDGTVVQGLHTGFVQCPPLPWLEQPYIHFHLCRRPICRRRSQLGHGTLMVPREHLEILTGPLSLMQTLHRDGHLVERAVKTSLYIRTSTPIASSVEMGRLQHLDESQRGDARFMGSGNPGGIWGRDQTSWSSTRGLGGHSAPSRPSIPSDGSDQARANSWEPQHDTASSAPVRTKNRTKQAQRRAKALETSVAQDAPPKTSKANEHKLPSNFNRMTA